MKTIRLEGLVAATHTPFDARGELNPAAIETQAGYLAGKGISAVFIGGSTGESSSLSLEERLVLTRRWCEVAAGTPMKVIVHVGSNCLRDSRAIAQEAQKMGASAISSHAPCYFKPSTLDALVDCMADVAEAAPETPFYFYDIPGLTGVNFAMPTFIEKAGQRMQNFAGVKFTSSDLTSYQCCLHAGEGRWDFPFGIDEYLLGALALGGKGAVGSGFNFAAPVYRRLMDKFAAGDFEGAAVEQFRGVQLVNLLASYGYMAAAKTLMEMLGVDVGQPRLPHGRLDKQAQAALRKQLETLGYFDWIEPQPAPALVAN